MCCLPELYWRRALLNWGNLKAHGGPGGSVSLQVDWWVPLYVFLAVLCARALLLNAAHEGDNGGEGGEGSDGGDGDTGGKGGKYKKGGEGGGAVYPPAANTTRRSSLRVGLLVVSVFYGFGGPLLGTQDLGACNMYSNLRAHGVSNHLLAPTDLLPAILPSTSANFELVRVESCTSAWINSIYPVSWGTNSSTFLA